jgi:hypothetical protein
MLKQYVFGLLLFSFVLSILGQQPIYAISSNIVISQIQLGNSASASNEFVEIYNNSATDTEITNWCLYYASAGSTQNGSKMACFIPEDDNLHLYLPAHAFAFLISNQLSTSQPNLGSDLKFSATLLGTAGHVRLIDDVGLEVDKVGWGSTAVSAEGLKPTAAPTTGKVLSRKVLSGGTLQDTDINSQDIEATLPKAVYSYGSVYEVQDVCANLDGIQTSVPGGYSVDVDGKCNPPPVDVCKNLDGLQTVVPNQYGLDENGNCNKDVCLNIDGIQQKMPDGMKLGAEGTCVLDLLPLKITELLPNPIGSDEGNEFIEIFNPNNTQIDLSEYRLLVGVGDAEYGFPPDSVISPNQYSSFSNDDIKFILVNTTGKVKIISTDNQPIDESTVYSNPGDGMAWALINGVWGYTNRPTPGVENLPSSIDPSNDISTSDNLTPCAVNQYRNPETNRCRLLAASASTLTPCKDGQYRSEETNRCRSIVADVSQQMPCAEGQERNPATNRCRSISAVLGSSTLTPCKPGQERNPDTNRCRNVVAAIPAAGYAPGQTNESSNNTILMWSLVSVGAIAICYGIWEWRQEIVNVLKKIRFFGLNK